jgi:tRNA(His) 5'-end guanylyltransferase
MNIKKFNNEMRRFNTSKDKVFPGLPFIVRITTDKLIECKIIKDDFHLNIRNGLAAAAEHIVKVLQADFAYIQGREINLYFNKDYNKYNRSVIKITSMATSLASSKLTFTYNWPVLCTSVIYTFPDVIACCDYFRWRQTDSIRNAFNNALKLSLSKMGVTSKEAIKAFESKPYSFKKQLVKGLDIPDYARNSNGIVIYFDKIQSEAINKKSQAKEIVERRKMYRKEIEYTKDDFQRFLLNYL